MFKVYTRREFRDKLHLLDRAVNASVLEVNGEIVRCIPGIVKSVDTMLEEFVPENAYFPYAESFLLNDGTYTAYVSVATITRPQAKYLLYQDKSSSQKYWRCVNKRYGPRSLQKFILMKGNPLGNEGAIIRQILNSPQLAQSVLHEGGPLEEAILGFLNKHAGFRELDIHNLYRHGILPALFGFNKDAVQVIIGHTQCTCTNVVPFIFEKRDAIAQIYRENNYENNEYSQAVIER